MDADNPAGDEAKAKMTRDEYFAALEKWLQDAYMWQCMNAWFPYMLMNQQQQRVAPSAPTTAGAVPFPWPTGFQGLLNVNNTPQGNVTNQQTLPGIECQIPPLWKRFAAEFLDFLILFSLKMVVTLVAVDLFELIDIEQYDFMRLLDTQNKMDYNTALKMTTEILVLETIHRIVVCMYEGFWLAQGGVGLGRIGGATPGKNIMGLCVVNCSSVTTVPGRTTVFVNPATRLNLGIAVARSIIKNFVLAFFFPICFTSLVFQHNRAIHDTLCKTIVVEDPAPRRRIF
ncbi:Hypothetical predicted protein [Cloeon dipterum]|uniref:RDD domain-containing protein n=1 Tax=Cloeon dipterum TaxID=197152 RepID=A0A8S1DSI4_9INSE|nr:Hypothetical predicted protein [Cloeon dipterum]